MVLEENAVVNKAAKKLAIKLCTARLILKKYKENGSYPMKKFKQSLKKNKKEVINKEIPFP